MRELYLFIEKRQIYLPALMCASLRAHLDNMSRHVHGVGAYGSVSPITPDQQQEQQQVFAAVSKAFFEELPSARKVLEDEFRKMLAAEALPNS